MVLLQNGYRYRGNLACVITVFVGINVRFLPYSWYYVRMFPVPAVITAVTMEFPCHTLYLIAPAYLIVKVVSIASVLTCHKIMHAVGCFFQQVMLQLSTCTF